MSTRVALRLNLRRVRAGVHPGRRHHPLARRLETLVIGPADAHWGCCFIARYPNAAAFLAMVTDPAYREAVKHRQAAVADSRLVRLGEVAGGAGFAE